MSAGAFPHQSFSASASESGAIESVFAALLGKIATVALVQVKSVTNSGGVAPVGRVSVQPMVHQVTGPPERRPVPHGVLYDVPYMRLQGGTNAVILDPQVGDIGLALFCSRDISGAKASKAPAPPGSARQFDWADGLYIGGVLNGTPVQYLAFAQGGITASSPTKITLVAPEVDIQATTTLAVTSPATSLSGALTVARDATIGGIAFLPHTHPDPGEGNTGPPQ